MLSHFKNRGCLYTFSRLLVSFRSVLTFFFYRLCIFLVRFVPKCNVLCWYCQWAFSIITIIAEHFQNLQILFLKLTKLFVSLQIQESEHTHNRVNPKKCMFKLLNTKVIILSENSQVLFYRRGTVIWNNRILVRKHGD